MSRSGAATWSKPSAFDKQISGELAASERTVELDRAHVMKKMQTDSFADLVRMAARLGLELPGAPAPVPEDR